MATVKATLVDKIIKLEKDLLNSNEEKEQLKNESQRYKTLYEETEINLIEQITMLQNEKLGLLEKLENLEKELKELKDQQIALDNIMATDMEINTDMVQPL